MGVKDTALINFIKKNGGLASYADITGVGFDKEVIKTAVHSGRIKKMDRGLYTLPDGFGLEYPDFVTVSIKVPRGVVCLISALSFHEATQEIPHIVDIAIPRGSHANKIKYPPVKFYRFASKAWEAGIEKHKIGSHEIKVYNLAKTLADCFKFRNKIGMDVVRYALKVAINEKGVRPQEIIEYAKICRVDKIMKPILEVML